MKTDEPLTAGTGWVIALPTLLDRDADIFIYADWRDMEDCIEIAHAGTLPLAICRAELMTAPKR